MKLKFADVVRDYLALRGESPELLPLLEEGEESAVLTLERELRARLPGEALKATLETPLLMLDEIREATGKFEMENARIGRLRLPDDYLKLYYIRMADWKQPVRRPEPEGSLRHSLGGDAPEWMICRENPMVTEERDPRGIYLRIMGSDAFDLPATVYYVPVPEFDGETLTISSGAYRLMMERIVK